MRDADASAVAGRPAARPLHVQAQLIAGRCSVRVQGFTVRKKEFRDSEADFFQKKKIQRQARLICSAVSRSFLVQVQVLVSRS